MRQTHLSDPVKGATFCVRRVAWEILVTPLRLERILTSTKLKCSNSQWKEIDIEMYKLYFKEKKEQFLQECCSDNVAEQSGSESVRFSVQFIIFIKAWTWNHRKCNNMYIVQQYAQCSYVPTCSKIDITVGISYYCLDVDAPAIIVIDWNWSVNYVMIHLEKTLKFLGFSDISGQKIRLYFG